MQRIAESPMAAQMPSEMGSKILHSSLVNDGFVLMASDMIGERTTKGNTITLCIHCSNAEEINSFFDKLAKDGKIVEPLHQTFWGATFGKLTDRFGIHWMFNCTKN